MRSILVACGRPDREDGPAASVAAVLAARTGAATHRADPGDPEAVLRKLRETGAELVVLSPRLPRASSAVNLDRASAQLVVRSPAAVLLVRPPLAGEIRRVLVPVRRADLERGSLAPALAWAARFCRTIHLLHVARSPDELHEDRPLLRAELARPGTPAVRRFECVRWGASPHARILRWISRHGADLVVLRRDARERPPAAADHAWFRVLGAADCPVLLLPLERGRDPSSADDAPVTGEAALGTSLPEERRAAC